MISLFDDNSIERVQSKSNEWFTPSVYVDAAREVMNGIDLDPASCEMANQTVKAMKYYTQKANGLKQSWLVNGKPSRVFVNPPYGGATGNVSIIEQWLRKLIHEYEIQNVVEAIALPPVDIDARWFLLLWNYPICFTWRRIRFYRPGYTQTFAQRQGNCFVYLGPNESKFIEVFSQFGRIAKAIDTPKPKPTMQTLWEEQA